MATSEVVVQGALTPDGRLLLDEHPGLPPGRVEVSLRPLQDSAPEERPMFGALKRIWAEQEARGFTGGRPVSEGDSR